MNIFLSTRVLKAFPKAILRKALIVYCKRLSKYIFYSSFSLLTFATKK